MTASYRTNIENTTAELARFAATLFSPGDLIELRAIRPGVGARSDWLAAGELPGAAAKLLRLNEAGHGIFAGLNPRREAGKRGDANALLARVLAADADGQTPGEARDRAESVGMPPPTMTVFSGGGTWLYWRLAEPLEMQFWGDWQADLAALLCSDPKIRNPERVARLPGFSNRKYDPPTLARIIDADPERIYDLADLPIPMRPGSDAPIPPRPRFAVRRIERGRVDPVERCRRYVEKLPPAISGAGGHKAAWRVAATAVRFGLSEAEALDVFRGFNARCAPPWSEREIAHKVRDAYRKNTHEYGKALASQRGTR